MSAILGFVQGVAEFLPISSSGHLTLFQHFFGMDEPDQLFNVLLHFATLLAVCVVYWRDIWEMIVEFFSFFADLFSRRRYRGNPPEARRMVLLIIVGTLPLFLVLPIKDRVEAFGNNPMFVCGALLVTGCMLFLSDQMARGHKNARSATLLDVLDVMKLEGGVPAENLPKYLLGMAVAAVVGYFSIQLVKLLASKGRFGAFAYYCWGAGALFILLNIMDWTFVPAA